VRHADSLCHGLIDVNLYTGAHFWILGGMNSSHGRYSVSVDGGLPETFSSYEPHWRAFVIMYERQLAPGPHHVVIRNEDDKVFCLDAIVYEMFTGWKGGVERD